MVRSNWSFRLKTASNRTLGIARVTLAVALLAAGFAKLVGGPAEDAFVPVAVSMAIAIIEIVAAALLVIRATCHVGLGVALLIGSAGLLIAMFAPEKGCGCLGKALELKRSEHMLLAALTGLVAVVGLWGWLACLPSKHSVDQGPPGIDGDVVV